MTRKITDERLVQYGGYGTLYPSVGRTRTGACPMEICWFDSDNFQEWIVSGRVKDNRAVALSLRGRPLGGNGDFQGESVGPGVVFAHDLGDS